MERIDKTSPFSPGKPVPVEFFVGRGNEIERIRRSLNQVTHGKNENLFILGDRGLGKSSLANYCLELAVREYNLLPVYCSLGGITTLNGFTKKVLESLVKSSHDKDIIDGFKSFFKKYIKETGLGFPGFINIKFQATNEELESLTSNFLPIIAQTLKTIDKYGKTGLFLVLDDLNGITKLPDFAHFLKSTVDTIAINYGKFPLFMMLIGVKERRNDLISVQPSVGRIFDIIQLERLGEEETRCFFEETYKSVDVKIDEDALNDLVRRSRGYPMFIHELGDAVFWCDKDDHITYNDAMFGVIQASQNIGHKYLDSQIYQAIKSEKYHSILKKIGDAILIEKIGMEFHKNELKKLALDESESNVLDNFLNRMNKLGFIVAVPDKKGYRRFANELYALYVVLQSMER